MAGANVRSLYGVRSVKLDTELGSGVVSYPASGDQPISLYVETGGTVTFKGLDGVADAWVVADASYINIAMSEVTSISGGAAGIHAIFG